MNQRPSMIRVYSVLAASLTLCSIESSRAAEQFYRAINLNGAAETIDGKTFESGSASALTVTGAIGSFSNQGVSLAPAADAALSRMIRSSIYGKNLDVSLGVPNGKYAVYAYVWEDNATQTFDLKVQGAVVRPGYVSGSAGKWSRLGPYASTVTNGRISVGTTGGDANLSGLELYRLDAPAPTACSGTGGIKFERWSNVSGESVGDIPLQNSATVSATLNQFEITSNQGDLYGSRVSGYLCVAESGDYRFAISGDDQAVLNLSSDENPANRQKIAEVPAWTLSRDFGKYSQQKSGTIALVAGKRYYIEALQKEGMGGDHLAVGITLPNGTFEAPISGNKLILAASSSTPPPSTPPSTPAPVPAPPAPSTGASTAEPSSYSAPLIIRQGGTYSGNYKSNTMGWDSYAIRIQTSEPVVIQNCHLAGPGILLNARNTGANVTVRNCSFHSKTQIVNDQGHGRAIDASGFKHLVVENNFFENTGTVIATDNYSGNGNDQTLIVRYNRVKNIDGRHLNGAHTFAQFVAMQNYNAAGNPRNAEIAWNEVINLPGQSSTEDLINIYQAGGRSDGPVRIHNNFLRGSYAPNPATDTSTGSGFIIDGPDSVRTSYILAYNNTVVSTTNAGINMAAGSNNRFYNNRIVCSGKLPNGTWIRGAHAGVAIFDFYGAGSAMTNNSIDNNVIGYVSNGVRRDVGGNIGNGVRDNVALPEVTLQMEDNEYTLFLQKVQAAGVRIGPQ